MSAKVIQLSNHRKALINPVMLPAAFFAAYIGLAIAMMDICKKVANNSEI